MWIDRIPLRMRLVLGFASLTMLLVVSAWIGDDGLARVGVRIGKIESAGDARLRIHDIAADLATIRNALRHYAGDGDANALQAAMEAETHAAALLAEDRRMADAVTVLRSIATSRAEFARLIAEVFTLRRSADGNGDTVTAELAKLSAVTSDDKADRDATAAAAIATLNAEINALRVGNDPDPVLLSAFEADIAAAGQALDHVSDPARVQPARDALGHFARAVHEQAQDRQAATSIYESRIGPPIATLEALLARPDLSHDADLTNAARDAETLASKTRLEQLALSVCGILAAIVLSALGIQTILRPVRIVTAAITRVASGNTDVPMLENRPTGEIGDMARAIDVFRANAIATVRLAAERDRAAEAKDQLQEAINAHIQAFTTAIAGVMQSFSVSAAAMRQAAADVSENVKQTQIRTATTVQAASTSARDLNDVAAATGQMSASISEISNQVTHVATSVTAAVARAAETDRKVAGLSAAADRIGDVVTLISDIARQTNMLAMNATIEAARAGEAGKGFAVVAGEVQALASQTAGATRQINEQIAAIRAATGEAVEAVRDVGLAIADVEAIAATIAAAVEQQAAATRDITRNVQGVTIATAACADAMRDILSIAQNTSVVGQSTLRSSNEIASTAASLRTELTDFFAMISQCDPADRRLYTRLPGDGAQISVRIADARPIMVPIVNISRGGLAISHTTAEPIGTDATIQLPGGNIVKGRIAWNSDNQVAFTFRQDPATVALIDPVLEALRNGEFRRVA